MLTMIEFTSVVLAICALVVCLTSAFLYYDLNVGNLWLKNWMKMNVQEWIGLIGAITSLLVIISHLIWHKKNGN